MKKVLVTMAVLAIVTSVSQASILQVWLTAQSATVAGQTFKVFIYGQIVADPNIPGESLTNSGLGDMSVTILGTKYNGSPAATPRPQLGVLQNTVDAYWGPTPTDSTIPLSVVGYWNSFGDFWKTTPAARSDSNADGAVDAVQLSAGDLYALDPNIGVGQSFLFSTEVWVLNQATQTLLTPIVQPSSRHWDPTNFGYGGNKIAFTGFQQTGVLVGPQGGAKPIITLGTNHVKVASGTAVTFIMTQTNPADGAATSSTFDPGDGTGVQNKGALPWDYDYTYNLGAGVNDYTYTATGTATNPTGTSDPQTTQVQVLRNPFNLVVTVDGVQISEGQQLTIYGHNFPTITATADGNVVSWVLTNGSTVLSSTNSWSGDSYNLYDGTLTFTAFADASAYGWQNASLNFTVIPEPATLALLGFGAVATLLRRRK